MWEFIQRANVANFRKLLATTINEDQRRTLLKLLAEEEAKAPPPEERQGDPRHLVFIDETWPRTT